MKNSSVAPLQAYMLISLILSIPVVLLNVQYFDDIARTTVGYFGWDRDGRPLVDLIYKLVSVGDKVSDLYPIPQISSYMILGYGCYLLSRKLHLSGAFGILLTLPILCSPMLLGNTLFRYDSITMALAMFLCVIPFKINTCNSTLRFILSSVLIGSALCLYQASLSVYIVLAIIFFVSRIVLDRDIFSAFKELTINAAYTITGYVIYLIVTKTLVVMSPAAIDRSALISINHDGISSFIDASKLSISILTDCFDSKLLFTIALIFISSLIYYILKNTNEIKKTFYISSLSLVFIAASFFFTFALVSLTKIPAAIPRSFMSFGFFVFGMLYVIYAFGLRKVSIALSAIISISMISLNAQALNAVKLVEQTQSNISNMVASSLSESKIKPKDIIVVGKIKMPEQLPNIYDNASYVKGLIWMHFDNQFASYLITYSGFPIGLPDKKIIGTVSKQKNKWQPIESNSIYSLYLFNEHAILEFK
ncbi:glucosyltransferase domain-containing protein [Hafnia paralvei]|uniref:glucosyltransferase domain-containing protein n=1 Tax=Hafnia paralvei TaxID=546367 RepID=UPI0018F081B2|nr:glucosyltransferase domain-containing protein [Hafnia paralvei]MBW2957489.1 glucosyltransferase domain-containing protein [Hafnia paralvei]